MAGCIVRAIVMSEPGPPDVLRVGEVEQPPARVRRGPDQGRGGRRQPGRPAAAQGHYPPPPGAVDLLGLEVSGTVADVGDGGVRLVGRRSVRRPAWPAAATRSTWSHRPVRSYHPRPGWIWSPRPGSIEVAATVSSNLELARLRAVTRSSWCTAAPAASARSPSSTPSAGRDGDHHGRKRGQAGLLPLRRRRSSRSPTAATGRAPYERSHGDGVDVILDNMGAKYLDDHVQLLATDGRLVIIGMQGGRKGSSTSAPDAQDAAPSSPTRCAPDRSRRRPRSAPGRRQIGLAADRRRHVKPPTATSSRRRGGRRPRPPGVRRQPRQDHLRRPDPRA